MKKKECPNLIIITPNMGVGDLVKEMLPSSVHNMALTLGVLVFGKFLFGAQFYF
jgi:hypothetical protein